jgi:23S rRNA (cytosine1962-C5)-methyltransferase
LVVSGAVAARVARGSPIIDVAALEPPQLALEAGSLVLLLDARSQIVGTALADPENEVLRILSRDPVDTLDRSFLRRKLREAWMLRESLGLVAPRAAFRLINGEGDGLGGFAIDIYGDFAVLYAYANGLLAIAHQLAEALIAECGVAGVVVKPRLRGEAAKSKVRQAVVGAEPPKKLIVEEDGTPFEVHLLGGLNVGLFCDMREQRRGIGRWVRGRRFLNTFSYTGAFSVAAARSGATSVTSVDIADGVLDWSRENFRLSGLDPDAERFRFVTSEVRRFLEEERAAGRRHDTILIDPPAFSDARASGWSAKNDYPDLIASAAKTLPDGGGILWLASNAHRGATLERQAADGIAASGRSARILETGGLPADFPTPLLYSPARYLEVMVLDVK